MAVIGSTSVNLTGPPDSAPARPSSVSSGTLPVNREVPDASLIQSQTGNTRQRLEAREVETRQASEFRELQSLRNRDREVRAHEQAHSSVGGRYTGAVNLTFQRGPDGRLYAVGGEVPIDTSPVPGNPQATLAKAKQVQRAALAPADPSSADRQIAARAQGLAAEAQREITEQSRLEQQQQLDERFADSGADNNNEERLGNRVDLSV